MAIPVIAVLGVPVAIMNVVHVVIVGDCYMAALWPMLMSVILMDDVVSRSAFIPVRVMFTVQVAIVNVVHVVIVGNCYMAAACAVGVGVILVSGASHCASFRRG